MVVIGGPAMTVAQRSESDADADMDFRGVHGQTGPTGRSRFMITDILSGSRSPCSSPGSSAGEGDGPRDLSVHGRDVDSDGHDSCTDSNAREGSVCSNGRQIIAHVFYIVNCTYI